MSTYLYRCTEQQLEQHLQRIAEEGDAVEHVIYKGGRDYVLVCRKSEPSLGELLEAIAVDVRAIRDALHAAAAKAVRS
ncbi:MAG: hypothetical protein HOQ43_07505 [Glycomyces artemisiae]|uniref:Uncharacterized protein n=1 Tax=Glycomyces artemisiae TaxID=1076443 RepID=A0A850C969_9ACTN|nr:hypothetical protein [Glycomyces artemisiae]